MPCNRSKGAITMNTAIVNATEYRDLPLAMLAESPTNPRRTFEDDALKELAESIRTQGVLSPLLVRPLTEQGFEIVFGARRYRAAQIAEIATIPVRIKQLTDAEALEAKLVENLQRRDVHRSKRRRASVRFSTWKSRSTASSNLPPRRARVRCMWRLASS
jgi:ParB/RepB/Spo0J family partition protein